MTTELHPHLASYGSFAHLKLGRNPRRDDPRTLRLAKYLDVGVVLPAIPETFDLTAQVPSWPMYGNDRLGDCTCAAAGHMVEQWTARVGALQTPLDADVELAYWRTGNPPADTGNPEGPTDDGRAELDVLNYWRQTGVGGDRIVAYVAVDPSNADQVRAALYLFGGLYSGIALPLTARGQAEWDVVGDGKTGDSAPCSWGGHAVPYLPFWDGKRIRVVTWGYPMWMTVGFHDAYTDELYAIVTNDFVDRAGRTPEGFDLEALQADLAAFGTPQTKGENVNEEQSAPAEADAEHAPEADEPSAGPFGGGEPSEPPVAADSVEVDPVADTPAEPLAAGADEAGFVGTGEPGNQLDETPAAQRDLDEPDDGSDVQRALAGGGFEANEANESTSQQGASSTTVVSSSFDAPPHQEVRVDPPRGEASSSSATEPAAAGGSGFAWPPDERAAAEAAEQAREAQGDDAGKDGE